MIDQSTEGHEDSEITNGFKKTLIQFYDEAGKHVDTEDFEEIDDDESPEDQDARMKLLDIFLETDIFECNIEEKD
ncbi:hypothetical protein AYI68_g5683 [Smittium mucronatum]|uniref:Uncharacterized protein n=1 Tax=Smittium mucronatum TaxID=133383 RepID=A0A1R0GTK5_9FUNG|nr:hypothetical protein AYI68_g5683 [Smittium mucronatum]